MLRPGGPWPLPLVVGKIIDPQLKQTPQGRRHRSLFWIPHLDVQIDTERCSLQLVVDQTVEPQFVIHGKVFGVCWNRPLQVAGIRTTGNLVDLKALSVIVNIDDA
jgi:hypothetical protein